MANGADRADRTYTEKVFGWQINSLHGNDSLGPPLLQYCTHGGGFFDSATLARIASLAEISHAE